MIRLAIVATHPIQYYSPWYGHLLRDGRVAIKVFYLWDFGVSARLDPGFGVSVAWDIPLLDGYEHEFVPNVSAKPGTGSPAGLDNPTLVDRIQSWNPDAILLMAYNYRSIYRLLLNRYSRRVPLIFRGDSHRLDVRVSLKESLRRKFIARVMRRFSAVLCVGTANRHYYRHHNVPDSRIFLSPHCVDNARFIAARADAAKQAESWKGELGIDGAGPVIMYLGKLQKLKRVGDIIAAFRRVESLSARLLIVGDGPMKDNLVAAAADDSRILWAPFQNQAAIPRTLMTADLVVLPSENETWGLVLNEAMCMGRGILASDRVGGACDLIEPGKNGKVFPVGDVNALTSILKDVVANPTTLERWGAESARRIERFSYIQASQGLYDALRFCGLSAGEAPPQ